MSITNLIAEKTESGQLSNDELVQIIEVAGAYLNLKSISAYAAENNLSYNGVKKTRQIAVLFGQKFIIDNA